MTAEPIILNGEVARNVIYYKDLLEGMRFYQEALEDLLKVPSIEVNPIAFYLQECAKRDRQLLEQIGLGEEKSPPSLPEAVGTHYSRLHTYFNTPPRGKISFKWRSSAIGILEHLGHYVWDLRFKQGEVAWVSGRVFDMVREEYEQKFLSHFEGKYKRLAGEATKRLAAHSTNPPAEEPTHSISLLPIMTATNFHSRYGRGVIYLEVSKIGSEEPYSNVYFDVGNENQILFEDLPGGKHFPAGIEADVGYVIDTLSEEGLVGKPKMSLKAALDYLAGKRE